MSDKTRMELLNELETLEKQRIKLKAEKKETMKDFNADIKDLDGQIRNLLEKLEGVK